MLLLLLVLSPANLTCLLGTFADVELPVANEELPVLKEELLLLLFLATPARVVGL